MVVSRTEMPKPEEILPGRAERQVVSDKHLVTGNTTVEPFPSQAKLALFGMGCFWGAEKVFWSQHGVISTQVGYSAGSTSNPTYEELCTGLTGHAEVVRVVYDPAVVSFDDLLLLFWDNHDPTQGMKQDIDVGTQYRSGIYCYDVDQETAARKSIEAYQAELDRSGLARITTELLPASEFYYAEDYHQQYLAKNPGGFCVKNSAGVSCPRGLKKK